MIKLIILKYPTWLPNPMFNNIKKNMTAHNGDSGIRAMASG